MVKLQILFQEEFGGRKKSESEDLDLEVGEMDVPDIEIPDINLEADFDVPDVDFNVSDIQKPFTSTSVRIFQLL